MRGDAVQEIDWQDGGLLDTLDELGLTENTSVILASDNAPQLKVSQHSEVTPTLPISTAWQRNE